MAEAMSTVEQLSPQSPPEQQQNADVSEELRDPGSITNVGLHLAFLISTGAGGVLAHKHGEEWPTAARRGVITALAALSIGNALQAGSEIFRLRSTYKKKQSQSSRETL
jgi:hypothetical protein